MSKKIRRVRQSNSAPVNIASETNKSVQQVTSEDFRKEYAYVLLDLRRVFILAAGMFALLIVINLVFIYLGK